MFQNAAAPASSRSLTVSALVHVAVAILLITLPFAQSMPAVSIHPARFAITLLAPQASPGTMPTTVPPKYVAHKSPPPPPIPRLAPLKLETAAIPPRPVPEPQPDPAPPALAQPEKSPIPLPTSPTHTAGFSAIQISPHLDPAPRQPPHPTGAFDSASRAALSPSPPRAITRGGFGDATVLSNSAAPIAAKSETSAPSTPPKRAVSRLKAKCSSKSASPPPPRSIFCA